MPDFIMTVRPEHPDSLDLAWEGKTMGEIARILKRYAAREVFKHLPRPT